MFKNVKKISTKLVITCVIIAILSSVVGGVAMVLLKMSDTDYSEALENYGFAQGDVGNVLAAFCRVDGNLHDAIGYADPANKAAAFANMTKQGDAIPALLDEVEAKLLTQKTKDAFATAKSAWNTYYAGAKELSAAAQGADAATVAQLQLQLVAQLDPPYMAFYGAMTDIMETKVTVGDEISTKLTNQTTSISTILFILLFVSIGLSAVLAMAMARTISRPIIAVKDASARLAQGDLKLDIHSDQKDEVGQMTGSFAEAAAMMHACIEDISRALAQVAAGNFDLHPTTAFVGEFKEIETAIDGIVTSLSHAMGQINQASEQVATGSDQVSCGAQALSQGATEQASSIEELSATINEISMQIKANAANATDAREKVKKTGTDVTEGNRQMQEMIAAMNDISAKSGEIKKIIKTIDDIAFQTNILALNAAVEAARAGTAGKGFAVVADEVRNLAGKSAEAAKNTASLIEETIHAVDNGVLMAQGTANAIVSVVEGSKDVENLVDKIATASNTQANAAEQITEGINQISAVVQTNSATAEESAAASEELSGQSQMLKDLVGKFRLKEGADLLED